MNTLRCSPEILSTLRAALIASLVFVVSIAQANAQSAANAKDSAAPVRIAVVVSNSTGLSTDLALSERVASRSISNRLEKFGFQFLTVNDKGECALVTGASIMQIRSLKPALSCIGDVTRRSELVVFYYVGQVTLGSGVVEIDTGEKKSGAPETIQVHTLLQEESAQQDFTSVIVVDALKFNQGPSDAVRDAKRGTRRILALGWPEAKAATDLAARSDFSKRLIDQLDMELEARTAGKELRDVRALFTTPSLLAIEGEAAKSRQISVEGLESKELTLFGSKLSPVDPAPKKYNCAASLRELSSGAACSRISQLAALCAADKYGPFVEALQQLRCNEDFVRRKADRLRASYVEVAATNTCVALEGFVQKFGEDYDLSEEPEMEKGVRQRNAVCEDERRQKEIAQIESGLKQAITSPDCAALTQFERINGPKLTGEQGTRLAAATTSRCELEKSAKSELVSCLGNVESKGEFCGGGRCFDTFRAKLPGDKYLGELASEPGRQANICREFNSMRSCFNSDACAATRCSHALRLTVAQGNLISHIEGQEKDAARRCEAAKEKEKQDRARAAREERDRNTFSLRLCNSSKYNEIWAAISYYKYDMQEWYVEGWWKITKDNCANVGGGMRRGNYYVYAYTLYGGQRFHWSGDFPLCVSDSRFERTNKGGETCSSNLLKRFISKSTSDSSDTVNFGSGS